MKQLKSLMEFALVGAVLIGVAYQLTNGFRPNCNIKGNISQTSGRKLYHVPGMEDYEGTRIDPSYGERWFCSEAEAVKAGWTRAPR